jgi:16S rRNA (adenine1518-N6/adenine1519-N6)-dimethyltransferase
MDDYSSPKRVLAERGLRARKRLGQNFLVDHRLATRIAQALPPNAFVVEIGGGMGALTVALARTARAVEVVEIDRGLAEVLQERFAHDPQRVRILTGDALELDLRSLLAAQPAPRAICGNLPYNITTPLLERVVETADLWDCAVLMVQREYARRLAARPGTPDYGSLSVFVAHYCSVELLFEAGAAGFYPAPAVASSVVRLRPRAQRPEVADESLLLWLIRAAFAQRRKMLLNSIASQAPDGGRPRIEAATHDAGIDPSIRGERLSYEEFVRLTNALHAQGFRPPAR